MFSGLTAMVVVSESRWSESRDCRQYKTKLVWQCKRRPACLRELVSTWSKQIHYQKRSKASVYGRSLAGIAGSNAAGGMDGCPLWVLCVLSGGGLCDGPIPRPEEFCRLWCVIVCDLETSRMRRPWPTLGCCARRKELWKVEVLIAFSR
jgi:hypothetical protein